MSPTRERHSRHVWRAACICPCMQNVNTNVFEQWAVRSQHSGPAEVHTHPTPSTAPWPCERLLEHRHDAGWRVGRGIRRDDWARGTRSWSRSGVCSRQRHHCSTFVSFGSKPASGLKRRHQGDPAHPRILFQSPPLSFNMPVLCIVTSWPHISVHGPRHNVGSRALRWPVVRDAFHDTCNYTAHS